MGADAAILVFLNGEFWASFSLSFNPHQEAF